METVALFTTVPSREELPLERVTLLERAGPLLRVALLLPVLLLPVERVTLLLRRLLSCCCTALPLERVVEEERVAEEEPLERRVLCCWVDLLPLERVEEVPLERVEEVLPEEREEPEELPCCWEELLLPLVERRVWAHVSGAVSMARASIKEAEIVTNLLIALKFLS
jgi:hypothetical protein